MGSTMVSDRLRPRSQGLIDRVSGPFMKFSPNSISVTSFLLAVVSGYFYFIGSYFLLFAFVALLISSLLDAVDGNVARKRNLQSPRGDLVDHFLDRFSDIAIITGMTLSVFGSLSVGFFALEGVLMTSYMGTQSQALGQKRNYSGIMGRSDRLILMMLIALIQYFFPFQWILLGFALTPTIILLVVLAVAGNVTAITRFASTFRSL